jgi:hypothetical protein
VLRHHHADRGVDDAIARTPPDHVDG